MIKKINSLYYLADAKEDLKNIKAEMGCECFVIKEACEYKILSTGEWIKQSHPMVTPEGDIDLSDYATLDYVDNAIENIPDPDLTDYAKVDDLPTWKNI